MGYLRTGIVLSAAGAELAGLFGGWTMTKVETEAILTESMRRHLGLYFGNPGLYSLRRNEHCLQYVVKEV